MKRRILLNTTALALPALALAACASTGTGTSATVQAVFNAVQFALPLLDVLALGIAVAVPAAAPIVAVVEPYIGSAGVVFQTLSATMTDASAKPLVQQIEGYLSGAVQAVQKAVGAAPAGSPLTQFAPKVAQAQAVLALLTTFIHGVVPGAALAPTVALPLLHR